MSTTIDSLEIEIQSNSSSAATGLNDLAEALEKIKKSTVSSTAVKNLRDLTSAMKELTPVASNAKKLGDLAEALGKLSAVGSLRGITNQLKNLPSAMRGLSTLTLDDSLGAKVSSLATALVPLSQVKAGGIGTIVNALAKISQVTDSLDDGTITRFGERVQKLNEKLAPLSDKMTTIQAGLRGINSSARHAGSGITHFDSKIKAHRVNLASLITIVQGVVSALQPLIRLFSSTISQALEWDGVAARFGRGFGDQAEEVYSWIQLLNKEMGINIQQFMQYSSVYATMLTGFGVGVKDAASMALGYTELTYDIWAGYNDIYKNFADAAEAVKSAIAGEVEPIRRAGFTIVESTLKQTAANENMEISLEKATEAQKSYLRYLTLVNQAHAQNLVGTYAREMGTAEGVVRTFSQQMKSLAQAFGSLFLPILVKVIPWLQAFVNLLTEAIILVAGFFGIEIQPINWSAYNGGSEALDGIGASADSAADSLGGAKKAAEDLKKATLGIDELNVISPPNESGGGGGGGGGGSLDAFEGMDIDSLWDKAIFDEIQFEVDNIKNKIKESLDSITAVISGFALAVGTILVVSGANIPVGLALMALGAAGLVATITANWNGMSDQLAKTLTTITSVIAGFLLAVGALLAFSGVNVPLGIALMAVGAVSLATAATINWKFLDGDMKSTLSIMTGVISGALLALGALFAFTGVGVGLGIALMVAGAVGLATTAALNWDSMTKKIKDVIAELTKIVSAAGIAVGAVLAFSGANVPIGLALMAAGAVGLVAAEKLKWDSTSNKVKQTLDTITLFASSALLAVGAVLAFSGANIPMGIALMTTGASGLVSGTSVNWKAIGESIKNVLKEIGAAAGAALLALGIILCLSGVGIPVGIGLIAAGAAGLVSGVALNWDGLLKKLKETWKKIETWWNDLKLKVVEIGVSLVKKGWSTFKAWIGSVPAIQQAVSLVKSGWSSLKTWIGESPTISAGIKLVKNGWSSVKSWLGSLNFNLGFKLPKIGINWGTKKFMGFEISYPKSFYTYAKGGFPDIGEMFIAREAGPEMVGKIGNKTTVANNEQIVEGISEGVYAAVVAAMKASETNGNQSFNLYLDGKQIAAAVEQRQRERGASIMGKQVYSY